MKRLMGVYVIFLNCVSLEAGKGPQIIMFQLLAAQIQQQEQERQAQAGQVTMPTASKNSEKNHAQPRHMQVKRNCCQKFMNWFTKEKMKKE